MQVAQHYPTNSQMQYGGYDNRSSYPSQSFVDPRVSGQQGYGHYYGGQHHHAPTVYPDAVYPSQYLPANNPQVIGHQQQPYQSLPNHYNPQYPPTQHPYPHNNLPFAHQPHYAQGSYVTQTRPAPSNSRTQIK